MGKCWVIVIERKGTSPNKRGLGEAKIMWSDCKISSKLKVMVETAMKEGEVKVNLVS